jgi:hypothetical protein
MANLVIRVADANIASPEFISVNIQVTWTDPQNFNRSAGGDLLVPATASAEAINAAIRTRGIDLAAAAPNGVSVGDGDVVRIFGGALPNLS